LSLLHTHPHTQTFFIILSLTLTSYSSDQFSTSFQHSYHFPPYHKHTTCASLCPSSLLLFTDARITTLHLILGTSEFCHPHDHI
jgi:hypothetical protein